MQNRECIIPDDYVEVTKTPEIQKLLLFLIKKIHEICDEHNIIYNVFGGTMLGAVRHHGMIPWDDDIDITMPRPDYDRFIEIVRNSYSDKYCVYVYPDKGYAYPFAKFSHNNTILIENLKPEYRQIKLYVDIFPVDGYPQYNESVFFNTLKKLKYKRSRVVCNSRQRQSGIWDFIKFSIRRTEEYLISLHISNYYIGKEVSTVMKNRYEDSEYILCQGAGWNQKGKLKKEIYLDRKLYDFDGIKVWGIADYHEHLTNLYGDYMQLPPVEKRVSNHDYSLYIQEDLLKNILQGDNAK